MSKKKKTNPRKRVLTQAEIDRRIAQGRERAKHDLAIIAIPAAAMALHDVFGFGPERIERFVENFVGKMNDFDNYYSIDDALAWFEEYTGMKLREVED